jgi:hypothetical protein
MVKFAGTGGGARGAAKDTGRPVGDVDGRLARCHYRWLCRHGTPCRMMFAA